MHVPPVENPTCAAFEVFEGVPKTVPLDFMEEIGFAGRDRKRSCRTSRVCR